MRLEHLADVHARRHAKRIEHDVDRRTVFQVRHVFHRHDGRDDALVAVSAGHLVARLHAALHGQVDLDHLEHARGQIVARGDLDALLFEALVESLLLRLDALGRRFQLGVGILLIDADLEPLLARQRIQVLGGDLGAGLELLRPARGGVIQQHAAHALVQVVLEDAALILQVLAHPLDLGLLDRLRPRVLLDAVAREHAHVDHGAVHARRHAQRGVLHVGGLLAEDGPQQLLFRRQLGLALGRDLADQDVAGPHLGTDEGDSRLIELGKRGIADVGDVGRDFLGPELGVASDAGELLDVDRREAILLHHALGDQDRILEVVAVPGHERDQHVLAQRQLAQIVEGPSASTSPRAIVSPAFTSGRWLMQVFWFERVYLVRL